MKYAAAINTLKKLVSSKNRLNVAVTSALSLGLLASASINLSSGLGD